VREIAWSHDLVIFERWTDPSVHALVGRIEQFLRTK
jgi:hypothetical protein